MAASNKLKLVRALEVDYHELSTLILATKTGPERNSFCDAQILILSAIDLIRDGPPKEDSNG